MRVLDKQHELLTITMEECGEVIQECSKIIRFGLADDNKDRLSKEIGDLYCMMILLDKNGLIDWGDMEHGSQAKLDKLKVWSNLFNELEKK